MRRGFLPTKAELIDDFSLQTIAELADGAILKSRPAAD
jgi:hypothetical protein